MLPGTPTSRSLAPRPGAIVPSSPAYSGPGTADRYPFPGPAVPRTIWRHDATKQDDRGATSSFPDDRFFQMLTDAAVSHRGPYPVIGARALYEVKRTVVGL